MNIERAAVGHCQALGGQRLDADVVSPRGLRPFDLRVTKQEIRDLGATTRDLPFSYVLILSSADRGDA